MEEIAIAKLNMTRSELEECLKQGTREAICKQCQISPRTLDRIIRDYKLTRSNFGPKRLTKSTARTIRELYSQGNFTQTQIAEKFGVSQALVCKIVNKCIHRNTSSLVFRGEAKARMSYDDQR